MKLISRRKEESTHVDRQKIGAVTTSNRHGLEQACARNTDLKYHNRKKKLRENPEKINKANEEEEDGGRQKIRK